MEQKGRMGWVRKKRREVEGNCGRVRKRMGKTDGMGLGRERREAEECFRIVLHAVTFYRYGYQLVFSALTLLVEC